ncbi:TIGR00282 family metallophosphoesterase [Mycoplasma struthionis]|uniref:TIGR00282 family metallophosphoesterase n=1 Tax=Mycoplasma struthionis TaxID=538220 RepID=A0A502M1C3_9MOLU|nr:TIGR00282 family metallophosphoesterase [Mycoplasma struthionis]TPI01140.1 TIGR00282 family metallophosphoesterase [Mycoplasma struthionis]
MKKDELNVLFLGDIFGKPGIEFVAKNLENLKKEYDIDFVIAQAENVSGRKGFIPKDYKKLKEIGIDAFTLGNHVWAKDGILEIINNNDLIRPANTENDYPGSGVRVFKIKGNKIAVMSFMGITFNPLLPPWKEEVATNFFDKFDELFLKTVADYFIIDFHAETTSEKSIFGLYVDGKVDALFGTHTHIQTNDAHILPKGTYYTTDAGMCGPRDCAIGSNFQEVYEKMRYGLHSSFKVSNNKCQLNGVVFKLTKNNDNKFIKLINIQE